MIKYIDADRLREKIIDRLDLFKELSSDTISPIRIDECKQIIDIIDSIQQDETQVDRMLCSQAWWEEQGWIMIPPNATIEGIDSLLKQVRKKLQQEQPGLPGIEEPGIPGKDYIPVEWVDACEMYGKWKIVKQEQPKDVSSEIAGYFGEDLPFEDERTKAAYHFFSQGRVFELKEIEEERKRHIKSLIDNYEKGMKAGYEKAIKDGKLECSPVMEQFIGKLFEIGSGFGPTNFQQELPEVDFEIEYAKFSNDPEADFAFPIDLADYKDFARHFFELGRNARKL